MICSNSRIMNEKKVYILRVTMKKKFITRFNSDYEFDGYSESNQGGYSSS